MLSAVRAGVLYLLTERSLEVIRLRGMDDVQADVKQEASQSMRERARAAIP